VKTIEPLVRISYPSKDGNIHELRLWENTSCINTEDLVDFLRMAWKLDIPNRSIRMSTKDLIVADYAGEGGIFRATGWWRSHSTLRILSTEKVAAADSSIDLFELLAAGIYPQEAVEDLLEGICNCLHMNYKVQERLVKMWKDVPFRIKAPKRRSAEGMAFQHRERLRRGYDWSTIHYITRALRNNLREMSILTNIANRTELPEGVREQCIEIQHCVEAAYENAAKAQEKTTAVAKAVEALHTQEKNDETDS
jgi:hypothetical protein